MSERKPFHESIVDVLNNCDTGLVHDSDIFLVSDILTMLLTSTKVPKNHDAIIAAWKSFIERGYGNYEDVTPAHKVVADLEEQKREAEAEAKTKQEARVKEAAADAYDDPY